MNFYMRFYELLELTIPDWQPVHVLSLNQTTRDFIVAYWHFVLKGLASGRFKYAKTT